MRRLTIMEHISLDGVIQNTGEDGFPHGDWTAPYRSPAGRDRVFALHGARFDLLLGRRTYDLWSGYWPQAPRSPLADAFNAATKCVVTHRAESLGWGPCAGVDGAAGVRLLKAQEGPDLILWGSSTVTSTLLEEGLADELVLMIYPVLLGVGKRLFAAGTPPRAFGVVSSQALPSGVLINHLKAAGPLRG